jgi:hypothetical protein
VVITDTETEIYDNEFYGCSNLTKVTIGDGVKKIGNWAFSGCSSLDHFAFGTNVESIGQEAFSDCTNVTNIRSYSAVPPVCGTQALDDINKWNCTLSVLESCQSAYQTAEQWKEFFFVNAMDKDGKVITPVIAVDSVVVTISCETAKTTIYYTTDGSEPTVESALYTGPFVVDKNCTIKAIAVRTNYYNSDISTAQVDYFVYAESIAIDYETVSIRLNESVTLTATVLPETTTEKGVVWSSSDENIATVENGIVTAHTIGEATITATTTDGTNLSATCKVTVLPILADTITLDQTNITAMDWSILVFSLGFVVVALITKIIGCGLVSMVCKIPAKHAIKVGVGMMTRGEVALIVAQKGMSVGLLDPVYFTSVILLIIISSILTPILLKLLYSKYPEEEENSGEPAKA